MSDLIVKFDQLSPESIFNASLILKYHSSNVFCESIIPELITANEAAKNQNQPYVKVVKMVAGGFLQRTNFRDEKTNLSATCLKGINIEKDWIKKMIPGFRALKKAGIEVQVAPWSKTILKDLRDSGNLIDLSNAAVHDIFLKINFDQDDDAIKQYIDEEFKPYESFFSSNTNFKEDEILDTDFLLFRQFIIDTYNSNETIRQLLKSAANIHVALRPSNSKLSFKERKQLSLSYIIEELANFFRYNKLGLTGQSYYPYINPNNPTAQLIVNVYEKLQDHITKNKTEIEKKYSRIAPYLLKPHPSFQNYSIEEGKGIKKVKVKHSKEKALKPIERKIISTAENNPSSDPRVDTLIGAVETLNIKLDTLLKQTSKNSTSGTSPSFFPRIKSRKTPEIIPAKSSFFKPPTDIKESKKEPVNLTMAFFKERETLLFSNTHKVKAEQLNQIKGLITSESKSIENDGLRLFLLFCIVEIQGYNSKIVENLNHQFSISVRNERDFLNFIIKESMPNQTYSSEQIDEVKAYLKLAKKNIIGLLRWHAESKQSESTTFFKSKVVRKHTKTIVEKKGGEIKLVQDIVEVFSMTGLFNQQSEIRNKINETAEITTANVSDKLNAELEKAYIF